MPRPSPGVAILSELAADEYPKADWSAIPAAFRNGDEPLPPPWQGLFGPLRTGAIDDLMVVGQIGQSLDGRIATESGHSHYINGHGGP